MPHGNAKTCPAVMSFCFRRSKKARRLNARQYLYRGLYRE